VNRGFSNGARASHAPNAIADGQWHGFSGGASAAKGSVAGAHSAIADGAWHSFSAARGGSGFAGRNEIAGGRVGSSLRSGGIGAGGFNSFGRAGSPGFAGRGFEGFRGFGFRGAPYRGFGGCWNCGFGWGFGWGLGFGWGYPYWGYGWGYPYPYWGLDSYWGPGYFADPWLDSDYDQYYGYGDGPYSGNSATPNAAPSSNMTPNNSPNPSGGDYGPFSGELDFVDLVRGYLRTYSGVLPKNHPAKAPFLFCASLHFTMSSPLPFFACSAFGTFN
jgi:hypothetical protein